MPFKIPAAHYGGDSLVRFQFKNGFFQQVLPGGTASAKEWAGQNAVAAYGSDQSNRCSIESIENSFPVIISHSHIRHNSAGKGKLPAGHGLSRRYELLENALVHVITERAISRPFGLFGGVPGAAHETLLSQAEEKNKLITDKCCFELKAGDSLIINTAGGGGWGKSS